MKNKRSLKKIFGKILFLLLIVLLSIGFSYGLKMFIDYNFILKDEVPYGKLESQVKEQSCAAGYYLDSSTCKKCDFGSYCKNNVKKACPKGTYASIRGMSDCTKCPEGYTTSNEGTKSKYSCNVCADGYTEKNGKCVKNSCTLESVTTDYKRISDGDNYSVKFTVSGNGCTGKATLSAINGKPLSTSVSLSGAGSYIVLIKASGYTGSSCPQSYASITVDGVKKNSPEVSVQGKWSKNPKDGEWSQEKYSNLASSEAADKRGVNYYYASLGTCSDSNLGSICFHKYYTRSGCGGSSPTPETKPVDVDICEESQTTPSTSNKTLTCNGTTSFKASDSKTCSVTTSASDFYKITCNEELTTTLKPELMSSIKSGLGFGYEIDIKTTRTCKGVFDNEKFLSAYNKVQANLKKLKQNSADYQTNLKKKQDLEKILNNYNNWRSNYEFDNVKATIKDEQLQATVNFTLKKDSLVTNIGNKVRGEKKSLNINGLIDPYNFTYTETYQKTLTISNAYYNLNNNVIYNGCSNCVSLGNKYYISNNSKYDNTDYKYTVSINGLGYYKNWSIKTNDCSLKVVSDESIYRPTDVNDPFLNNANPDRVTGKNWLNDTFDFTGIIKSDTWSQKSLYEFNVSTTNIKNIRKNNHELGANAYIGIDCNVAVTTNRYYCSFLRNSQYFVYHYIYTDELH